jgi:hypothetical protein
MLLDPYINATPEIMLAPRPNCMNKFSQSYLVVQVRRKPATQDRCPSALHFLFSFVLSAVALVGTEAVAILAIFTVTRVAAQDAPTTTLSEPVVVSAPANSEDNLIGENQQPEWTTHRRFPTTRVYVLPP